jgi:hypothetical protein
MRSIRESRSGAPDGMLTCDQVVGMNKIIREHYPVSSLPKDLREGLNPNDNVRVIIEESDPRPELKKKDLLDLMEQARTAKPLDDDPVGRIRKLRDEWDN